MLCPQLSRWLDPGLTDPPLLALPMLIVSPHCVSGAPPAASTSMNLGGGNGGGGESGLELGIAIGRCALENGIMLERVAERSEP